MSDLNVEGDLDLPGLRVFTRSKRGDARGYLSRIFCFSSLQEELNDRSLRQINLTETHRVGVVRGLHYQKPPAQELKVVTCISGAVWDLAVDLRRDSKTFLEFRAIELSAENRKAIVIPEGFAHGFQVLRPSSQMIYCHTADYDPSLEAGINATDQRLKIPWPLKITERSDRDKSFRNITADFVGI